MGKCDPHDDAFAEAFARHDRDRYRWLITGMARVMFDRDTAPPGPPDPPEDLLGWKSPPHWSSRARTTHTRRLLHGIYRNACRGPSTGISRSRNRLRRPSSGGLLTSSRKFNLGEKGLDQRRLGQDVLVHGVSNELIDHRAIGGADPVR